MVDANSQLTVVERVARALCAIQGKDADSEWKNERENARLIIEHMREPTPAMCAQGDNVSVQTQWNQPLSRRGKFIGAWAAKDAWEKMVKAALSEA